MGPVPETVKQQQQQQPKLFIKNKKLPWRRVAVDIASASGTRRPGFESRQGIRVLG
jgi:DNA invertase Pin-like site-specific DNA recombinase